MRPAVVLLLVVSLLLLLPPPLHGPAGSSSAPSAAQPRTFVAAATSPIHPALPPSAYVTPLALRNTTYVPSSPAPDATPISARSVTPPIRPPATTPVVVSFLANSPNCCVSANFTTPAGGPWAAVILNYTGSAVGGVYDSSFRAYVDQVQVLFGTTPEYGIWYVEQDLTPYESLFNGTYNFTFLLSAATVGGHFVTTVSVSFYPLAPGELAPTEPDLILPIFHRVFVSTSSLTVTAAVSVPTDVRNATLEMWSYGFGPDEFWYAGQQTYRSVGVSVDGQGLVDVLPFPYINTGGSDLFAWRPITAAFTLNDRPYDYEVTGALGLLEGNHTFSANVSGVTASSNWLIGGALLLYTDANVGPATLQAYHYSQPPAQLSTDHATYFDESATASYSYSSTLPTPLGSILSTTFANESFSLNNLLAGGGSWDNVSGRELLTSSTHEVGPSGDRLVERSVDFRIGMDLGQTLVISSTTGGGYPMFGNFTSYFLNADQEWLEDQDSTWAPASGGPLMVQVASVHNHVAGGTNVYAGAEELTGPNAALLLAITFIQSSTSDDVYYGVSDGALAFNFHHFLSGSAYNPPAPYNEETVLVDSATSPISATLSATPSPVEVGQQLRLSVASVGGFGALNYGYDGLPDGCAPTNRPVLVCLPTTPGTYTVGVSVFNASGAQGPTAVGTVQVVGPPTAAVLSNETEVDLGQPAYAVAVVTGGLGPFTCVWSSDGVPSPAMPCSLPFSTVTNALGSTNLSVVVTDSVGGRSLPSFVVLPVVAAPWVTVSPATNLSVHPGGAVVLNASVLGGVAPFSFVWYVDGAPVPSFSSYSFVFLANATGVFAVSVKVIDSTNVSGFAVGPSVSVELPSGPGPATTTPETATPLLWVGIALGGTIAGALVGGWLGYRRGRRGLRPSGPPSGASRASKP